MVVLWFPSGLAGPKSPEKENAATPKFSVPPRYMVCGSETNPHVVIAEQLCYDHVL